MPYTRGLGFPIIDQLSVDEQSGGDGIDWTQVITTGEQVVGGIINHGSPIPTRYPTYYPTSSALQGSNLMPIVLIGVAALVLMRRR